MMLQVWSVETDWSVKARRYWLKDVDKKKNVVESEFSVSFNNYS